MISASQAASAACADGQGVHCASVLVAWRATSAAALARSSTARSSSCVSTPPPKSFDVLPATFTRSRTVLLYWLGVSRCACNVGALGAAQLTGPPMAPPEPGFDVPGPTLPGPLAPISP